MRPWLSLLAEIMDKEPAAIEYWILTSVVATASFLTVRWRAWTLVIVLPLVLLFVGAEFLSVNDPCFHAAILQEAGGGYVAQVHASLALALLGPLVPTLRTDLPKARAWWSSLAARRRTNTDASAPYRASTAVPPAASPPWRLLLVFVSVVVTLLVLACLQWHRLRHRCIWEP